MVFNSTLYNARGNYFDPLSILLIFLNNSMLSEENYSKQKMKISFQNCNLCFRHHSKCFTYNNSFNPHKKNLKLRHYYCLPFIFEETEMLKETFFQDYSKKQIRNTPGIWKLNIGENAFLLPSTPSTNVVILPPLVMK